MAPDGPYDRTTLETYAAEVERLRQEDWAEYALMYAQWHRAGRLVRRLRARVRRLRAENERLRKLTDTHGG
jgi:hypothetical protein